MTDNSTKLPTDKLVSQDAPVASLYTPPPVATPPIVAPALTEFNVTPSDTTTNRITAPNVTPPVEEPPQRDTLIDPRVVALRAMFPDYDDLILCVRSTLCLPINLLLTHLTTAGYPCLNL